jgi:hypothetical protein
VEILNSLGLVRCNPVTSFYWIPHHFHIKMIPSSHFECSGYCGWHLSWLSCSLHCSSSFVSSPLSLFHCLSLCELSLYVHCLSMFIVSLYIHCLSIFIFSVYELSLYIHCLSIFIVTLYSLSLSKFIVGTPQPKSMSPHHLVEAFLKSCLRLQAETS